MSEKSLEGEESLAAGWLTMPLVSSSLLELASMPLPPRLHAHMGTLIRLHVQMHHMGQCILA